MFADIAMTAESEINNKLIQAAKDGNIADVKTALKEGADINAKYNTNGLTALEAAWWEGHKDIVKMLLDMGADVNNLAKDILMTASTVQEAYYVDNSTYCDSVKKLEEDIYGLDIYKGVTLQIISADKDHYQMIAFHEQGNKKYQISGPGGKIEEYMQ
jgi:ankyrin repeat protein